MLYVVIIVQHKRRFLTARVNITTHTHVPPKGLIHLFNKPITNYTLCTYKPTYLLEPPHIPPQVLLVVPQVDHGVAHHLPGPVPRHLAPSIRPVELKDR